MWKYTVEVNGMMCGMCEAHVNDAVRKACPDPEGAVQKKRIVWLSSLAAAVRKEA